VEDFIDGVERALDEARPDDPIDAVREAALYTLHRAADNPLLKAAVIDDGSDLLSFLTTRGQPAMTAARASFERYYSQHWPALPADDIALAAETITRLTFSYLVLPSDAPAEALATRLADLARKLLRKEPART
jgi:hypothetical protein